MTTGYDYIEDEDQEGINTISDFFEKVFPIKKKEIYTVVL